MAQCQVCQKKLVTPSQMERHMLTHSEPQVQSDQPVTPEPVATVAEEKVVLRFKVPVQVTINGVKYPETEGRVIEAPNLTIATEIVRLVRDSQYGDVLER